jgi:GTP pyrophosphokinase
MDQERQVEVKWNSESDAGMERSTKIIVTSNDTPGLLKLMSEAFSIHGININNANIRTTKDKKAVCHFDVSVKDASQLTQVMFDLQKIKGIIAVERMNQK